MSLTLTLTGTGGAQGVPAWGCECAACARARRSPQDLAASHAAA